MLQDKIIYERKVEAVLKQIARRPDGQLFCRLMALWGDRQLKPWHKVEPMDDARLKTFVFTGRRAHLPKDQEKAA